MGAREAAILAGILYLDREDRRRNYEEWRDRMESNIRRWEDSLEKLESVRDRCRINISRNEERLKKSEAFYERITTGTSKEWCEHTKTTLSNTTDIKKKDLLQAKIDEYDTKMASVEDQLIRLKSWIENDRASISNINSKISDIEDKISNVKSKL